MTGQHAPTTETKGRSRALRSKRTAATLVAMGLTLGPMAPTAAWADHDHAQPSYPTADISIICTPHDLPASKLYDLAGPHQASVECVEAWEVVKGRSGHFEGNQTVVRQVMASMVTSALDALGQGLESGADLFHDDDRSVHQGNINKLASAGLVSGKATGTFDPTGVATRGQFTVVLVRALEHLGVPLPTATSSSFTDTGAFLSEPVAQAAAMGLVSGKTSTTFDPNGTVTRYQAATMMAKFLSIVAKAGLLTVEEASAPESLSSLIEEGLDTVTSHTSERAVLTRDGTTMTVPALATEATVVESDLFSYNVVSSATSKATMAVPSAGMVLYVEPKHVSAVGIQLVEDGIRLLAVATDASAPTSWAFDFELPARYSMHEADGGVAIRDENNRPASFIEEPWGRDRDGADVPVALTVDGTTINLLVSHGASFTYPVIADPWQTAVKKYLINQVKKRLPNTIVKKVILAPDQWLNDKLGCGVGIPVIFEVTDPCSVGDPEGWYPTQEQAPKPEPEPEPSTPPSTGSGSTGSGSTGGGGTSTSAVKVSSAKGTNAQGVDSGCTSSACHWIVVSASGLKANATYSVVTYGNRGNGWELIYRSDRTTNGNGSFSGNHSIWGWPNTSVKAVVNGVSSSPTAW